MRNYLKVTQVLVALSAVIVVAATVLRGYAGINNLTACASLVVFGFIGCMYAIPALKQQAQEVAKVKPLVDTDLMGKYLKFMEKKQA